MHTAAEALITKQASVLLLDLIDPSLNYYSSKGSAPFTDSLSQGLFPAPGLEPDPLEIQMIHLGILATVSDLDAKGAFATLQENPYWQYFCGFRYFQTDLGSEWENFPRFYSKIQKHRLWQTKQLNFALRFMAPKTSRHQPKRIRLRSLVSSDHSLVIARKYLLKFKIESFCPPSLNPSAFLLGLLGNSCEWTTDWAKIKRCYCSNVYWQYFCGTEYFSKQLPNGLDRFFKMKRQLVKSENWKKAERLFKTALNTAQLIANTEEPDLKRVFERTYEATLSPVSATVDTDSNGIPILCLIDPSKDAWARRGCAPLTTALENGLYETFDLRLGTQENRLFHLSLLAALLDMEPSVAMGTLLENPHWQYFCGYRTFQREPNKNLENFPRFYARLARNPLWTKKNLHDILKLAEQKIERSKSQRARLQEIVSSHHALVLAKDLLRSTPLEGLRPPSISPAAFKLGLLGSSLQWTSDWKKIQSHFKSNVYWQYFCDYEFFSSRLPEKMEVFLRSRTRLQKSEKWKKAQALFAQALANEMEPQSIGLEPLEFAMPNIQGNAQWSMIAAKFKKRGWSTTFIGSDDLLLAQANLYGPMMRFVPFADKQLCEITLSGKGDFADVIVVESTPLVPGKIIYITQGPQGTHRRLDNAVSNLHGLDELLENAEAQKRYFDALSLVYGSSRFPRRSFDALIRQLREILPDIPELKERLWEPRKPHSPSFAIHADVEIYGRAFDLAEFTKFLDSFLREADEIPLDSKQAREFIRKTVDETDDRIRRFEIEYNQGTRSETRNEFYSGIKAAPATQQTVKLLLRTCLRGSTATEIYQKQDADDILRFFKDLKQGPSSVLGESGVISFDTHFWPSLLRPALPAIAELLRHLEAFPIKTRKTRRGKMINQEKFRAETYDFIATGRKLHGIWRGITENDCVGGNSEYLDQLMPERWGCSLLDGTILYDIAQGGKIQGYLQLVPFEYEGERYASVDTQWSPFFAQSEKGKLLFLRCLEMIRPCLPADWKGLVVGAHPAGHAPFQMEVLHSLSCYKKGRVLGSPENVRFKDQLAKRIVEVSEKRGYGSKFRANYGSRMLTDASLIGEKLPLVVLNLDAHD